MAQREQVFVGQPSIFGGARLLPSPSQFFLTGEDKLRVVSANSLVGVSLKVQWRTATITGDVVPSSQDHTPNSDRTVNRQDYELGSGSLLNVTVFASAGAPLSGQTFVIVQLVRGDGPAAIVLGTLLAGYVTAVQALGFPGSPIASSTDGHGAIRTIIGTSPAAGVECAEVVPTGARWELVSFVATIVTSATVITRVPELYVDMAGSNFCAVPQSAGATAGATITFTWGVGCSAVGAVADIVKSVGFPTPFPLRAGSTLRTFTVNIQPGDRWTVVAYSVREWLEVS